MVFTTSAARTISSVQGFGVFAGDVDVSFGHHRDGGWGDLAGRLGAAGPGDGGVRGQVGEEPLCRWLLAATIAVAIGLFTNLVLTWPFAVLTALVAAAALLIWDHRHGTIADWWPGPPRGNRLAAIAARLERQAW